jgi:hypothetical protein
MKIVLKLIYLILVVHILLALVCFLTMDSDMGKGSARTFADKAIDSYEYIGQMADPLNIGEFTNGILIVTLALVILVVIVKLIIK